MKISRALPFLLVLGLSLHAASVRAEGPSQETVACVAAIKVETDEAATWDRKFFEALPDAELSTALPARIAALKIGVRKACDGSKVTPKEVDAILDLVDKMIPVSAKLAARERACRDDAKCMASRAQKVADDAAEKQFADGVVLPLCEATWGLENERAVIAQERANPSGVVNLADLHSAGSAVQYYQSQIAAGGRVYAARRHHPFKGWMTENVCLISYDASMAERGCTRVELAGGMHSWNCGQ